MNLFHLFLALATMLAMEVGATLFHRHVMHGIGWGWHRSHHTPRGKGWWEKNDLYALVFSLAAILLFVAGGRHAALWWIALGMTLYGLLYGILHDVLIHKRLPLGWRPKNRYLRRLMTAHYLHHAVKEREGCVSFGFLYAPPEEAVRRQLRAGVRKP